MVNSEIVGCRGSMSGDHPFIFTYQCTFSWSRRPTPEYGSMFLAELVNWIPPQSIEHVGYKPGLSGIG